MTEIQLSDPVFWLLAVPAVLVAGISKGGFGSGAAFAATPLLALALPPQQAVGMMLPLLMVMDATGLRAYWRGWSWRDARALMLGGLPGVALGAALYAAADADAIRLLIGMVALGFVAFQFARSRGFGAGRAQEFRVWHARFWGLVAGFTSFVSHAGGPPAAVHLLGRGLGKTGYQATTILVFWWINLVKLPPYLALGLIGRDTIAASLWLLPAAVAGMLIGVWAHRRLADAWFFRMIYLLLTLTGAKLAWEGVTGLLS